MTASTVVAVTPVQLLRRARQIIEQNGWCQHEFGHKGGPRCASGALIEAMHETGYVDAPSDVYYATHRAYNTAIHGIALAANADHVPAWNDSLPADTGRETVMRAMEAAAQELLKEANL